MEKLFEKISSYNLFNYLLPGAIFIIIIEQTTKYALLNDDILINALIAYFAGLIISRIGSLIIEPLLKKISFVTFSDYKDFVLASKKDNQIEVFSETNNMYRSFISVFLVVIFFKLYEEISNVYPLLKSIDIYMLIVSLLMLFLFAYKKQSSYINKRVELYKEETCQQ